MTSKSGQHLDLATVKVLCLTGTTGHRHVNYSRELLSIGLRRLIGNRFVDVPKNNVLYKECSNLDKYVGRGYTYGGCLENDIKIERDNIEKKIKKKEFNFILYGKVGNKRGEIDSVEKLPYWNLIHKTYSLNEIVFLYGGDMLRTMDDQDLKYHTKYGLCFVRELSRN